MQKTAAVLWAALGALVVSAALQPTTSWGAGMLPAEPPAPTPPPAGTPLETPSINPPPALDLRPAPKASEPDAGEVRAMWIVRDAMTSPQKIRNAVALAKRYHFNTLFVQVRGRGDAYYDSHFEPRAEELARQPRDFDPLAVAVAEGHRQGLQVHAWMNTFLVWHKGRRPYSARHVVNRHPEWLVRDRHGRATLTPAKDCEGAFLDPAYPEVREHTKDVFLDVVTRYEVDGIHFDYVRFPCELYSFSDYDLERFRQWVLPRLTPNDAQYADRKRAKNRLAWYYLYPHEWRAWRQSLVTETVRAISEAAHQAKPGLIVSAAVFPNYRVAAEDKGQAWREWLHEGLLDAACPMTYNRSTALVARQIRDAVAAAGGKPIIAGVGAWQMPANSAIAKGRVFRALGAAGVNFFSYNGMTRDGQSDDYLAKLSRALFPNLVARPDWRHTTLETAGTDRPGGG